MIEYMILKLFIEQQDLYDKYYKYLKLDYIKINYPVLYKLFRSLPATSLTELEATYLANYPIVKEGDRDVVRNILTTVTSSECDETKIIAYLQQHLSQSVASELAIKALEVAEGRCQASALQPIYELLEAPIEVEENEDLVTTSLSELADTEEEVVGLTWQLNCLNRSLGPIRIGNLGHIAARIETGKTALWVSEVVHMAQQLPEDANVCVFFNEEEPNAVVWRMYSSLLKVPYKDLVKNVKHYEEEWNKKIGSRIKFFPPEFVEKKKMERIIEKYKPQLIIVDNADKILGFDGDREDIRLHNIYKWLRTIAQKYAPILSVGQADFTGANQRVITESQLAGGKTGKPSELDFLITIGKIDKEGYENMRFISTPRNKLRGNKDTIESMRHLKGQDVMLNAMLSIYEDM